ncbi:MAG: DUF697 domain-containing protein [Spirochaetales bacterium]|nr:DUF697 domain-containing protein [Spirochaetales bacterium]
MPLCPVLAIGQQIKEIWNGVFSEVQAEFDARLTLGFMGSPSAGKDSLIRALFGIDTGEISPIPGSTSKARAFALNEAGSIRLLTAPGVGDARKELTARAHAAVEELDLVLLVVSVQSGVDRHVKQLIDEIHCPVIVALNKIDLLDDPAALSPLVQHVAELSALPLEDILPCAADPHPDLGPPQGLSELSLRLAEILEKKGKSLVLARILRERDALANRLIERAALSAGAVGVIPLPGPDFAPLTAIQTGLLLRLARVYGVETSQKDVGALLMDILAGNAGKALFGRASSMLRAAGWSSGALMGVTAAVAGGIAASITYSIGQAGRVFYRDHGHLASRLAQDVFGTELDRQLDKMKSDHA